MWNLSRHARRICGVAISVAAVVFTAGCSDDSSPTGDGQQEVSQFEFSASDFEVSTNCKSCHPQHFKEWSGSRHAYAMRDPVWMAIRNAGQSAYAHALAGSCSPCHGTVGLRSGEIQWGPFNIDDLPPQVGDGVGCDVCHVITSLHGFSNAEFNLEPGRTKYGTIRNPVPTPAHDSEYRSLYKESAYCGSCHDFILDNGTELEAVFREWQDGGAAVTGKTCNDCHMPTYEGRATPDGPIRTLHRHTMEGVDVVLTDFPEKEEQRRLVGEMLRNAVTLEADIPGTANRGEEMNFTVRITNDKTGHNVPSGVPFNREMWLSIVVRDGSGTVVYSTGQLDQDDNLMDSESDPDLFNVQATMLRADSVPTGATWEAAYITNPSIKPGETRTVPYSFTVPSNASGNLTVEITLRFRSFGPGLFRDLGLADLLPIPIFDMAEMTRTVTL